MIGGLNTETQSAVTATSQTAMATLEATNTISVASLSIRADATMAVGFTRAAEESYSGNLDYVSLIATNNFFVACKEQTILPLAM